MNFSETLIHWYHQHKRDLPWRHTHHVYHIWVSEIILQQTRVAQGMDYYYRFLERFPDIHSLAQADESEVLKVWQGLGFYSRARNMHAAAKQIVDEYKGIFPSDHEKLLKIKGIGTYTAAALLSFGYNRPYPVIDGNVKRVLSRLYAIDSPINKPETESLFTKKLQKMFDTKNPATFNQAIMEFGALQCKPQSPDCGICVFNNICKAFKKGEVLKYPVMVKKKAETMRFFYYIVADITRNKQVYTFLQQRKANDIWKNLYEFPLIETKAPQSVDEILDSDAFLRIFPVNTFFYVSASGPFIHKLTHQIIHARFIRIFLSHPPAVPLPEVLLSDLPSYPVSRLTDKYLTGMHPFIKK